MMKRFFATVLVCSGMLPFASGQTAPTTPAQAEPSPEVKQMQKLENAWSEGINQRDQYALEIVLSPIFVDISSTGDVTTRNQQIANLVTKTLNIQDMEQKVITVRMLGDIALVNGTYSFKKKSNGSLAEEKGVFTHVYQRARSNWLCVNSQRTPIVEKSLSKKQSKPQAEPKKKSNAELPLHIPFLHKGADKNADPTAPTQQPK